MAFSQTLRLEADIAPALSFTQRARGSVDVKASSRYRADSFCT